MKMTEKRMEKYLNELLPKLDKVMFEINKAKREVSVLSTFLEELIQEYRDLIGLEMTKR